MTNYLSPATIRAAVDRLGQSRGQSILVDYLVFKRALVIDPAAGTVVTGIKAGPYNQAIEDLNKVADRKRDVKGKSVSVRVNIGGRRTIKIQKKIKQKQKKN